MWLIISGCMLLSVVQGNVDYHKYLDEYQDFVDPLDPFATSQDLSHKTEEPTTQKERSATVGECPICPDCPAVDSTPPSSTTQSTKYTETTESTGPTLPSDSVVEDGNKGVDGRVYFQRFVNVLLRKVERKLPSDMGERRLALNLLVQLGQSDVNILRQFSTSDHENYQDVTDILTSMLRRVSLADNLDLEQWDLDEIFGINVSLVLKCIGSLLGVCMLALTLTKIPISMKTIFGLAMCLFIISIPWEWLQLYRKAVARRASDLSLSRPEDCTPMDERSWPGALKYWAHGMFSYSDDPCIKYHEAFVVDPFLDATPLEAFTTTATKFFVNPLQYIGAGVAKFFNEILKNSSTQMGFFLCTFVMIVFVLWLIMRMDYQIRLPWFLGGIERAPRAIAPQQVEYIQDVHRQRSAPLPHPSVYPAYLQAPQPVQRSLSDQVLVENRATNYVRTSCSESECKKTQWKGQYNETKRYRTEMLRHEAVRENTAKLDCVNPRDDSDDSLNCPSRFSESLTYENREDYNNERFRSIEDYSLVLDAVNNEEGIESVMGDGLMSVSKDIDGECNKSLLVNVVESSDNDDIYCGAGAGDSAGTGSGAGTGAEKRLGARTHKLHSANDSEDWDDCCVPLATELNNKQVSSSDDQAEEREEEREEETLNDSGPPPLIVPVTTIVADEVVRSMPQLECMK